MNWQELLDSLISKIEWFFTITAPHSLHTFPVAAIVVMAFTLEGVVIIFRGAKRNKIIGLPIFIAGLFFIWLLGAYLPIEVNVDDANMAAMAITVIILFVGAFCASFMDKEPSY